MIKCIICGKGFETGTGYTRGGHGTLQEVFCSLECRKIYKGSIQTGTRTITCTQCGKSFEVAKSSSKKMCDECKQLQKEQKRHIGIHICENCGKEYEYDYRDDPGARRQPSRFCSRECCNKHSNTCRQGLTKKRVCPVCGEETISFIAVNPLSKCPACQKKYGTGASKYTLKRKYSYKYPEGTPIGKFERSGLHIQKSKSLRKLNFDFNNPNLEEEYLKLQKLLVTEYEINLKSAHQIEKEYGLASNTLTTKLLPLFEIKVRTASEAISTAILTGRANVDIPKEKGGYQYHCGYHTDWEGNSHYLRSSYEFDFAKKLDEQKVHYETEALRFRYFDSQKRIYRTAVPDFYLPEKKAIVETKSCYFYDPINLNDRKPEIEKLGFKFYVYLDKEVTLEDFLPLDQLDMRYKKHRIPTEIKALLYIRDKDFLNLEWEKYQSDLSKIYFEDLSEEDKRYIISCKKSEQDFILDTEVNENN